MIVNYIIIILGLYYYYAGVRDVPTSEKITGGGRESHKEEGYRHMHPGEGGREMHRWGAERCTFLMHTHTVHTYTLTERCSYRGGAHLKSKRHFENKSVNFIHLATYEHSFVSLNILLSNKNYGNPCFGNIFIS